MEKNTYVSLNHFNVQQNLAQYCKSTIGQLNKFLKNNKMGFSGSSDGKESACNAGDPGSIPGSGRPSGEGLATPSRGAGERLQSMGSQRVIHY